MRKTFIIALTFMTVLTACRERMDCMPEAGVSRELAHQRKAAIKDLHYSLDFRIPEDKKQAVEGTATITFELDQPGQVALDFREDPKKVLAVKVNGSPVSPLVANEHIIIPRDSVRKGANEVVISFVAGDQSLNRNDDYLYTLLVPDRARTLFPCFDQPDMKAVFSLRLDIPAGWVAVANASVTNETVADGRKMITFADTHPLPTYLFSFVAGRWQQISNTRDDRTVRLYHRETDSEKLAQTDVIFDQVFAALHWMEEYTGISHPFEKYDLVIVPGFQFGGMEHPGAVLYNDKRMFLSASPSIQEQLGRMELISHETAHMWFGDDVTMAWFDDVWTKEVFANYFAARMTEPQFPGVNHRLNALRSFYPAAYSEDRTQGTNAIRQPLDNLNSAGLIYGQIVYNKAPIMMTKLVELMGEEAFRSGIQEYLRTYAYSNATWDDLVGILDRNTPVDLAAWSHAWVDERGMPQIAGTYSDGCLAVEQTDPLQRGVLWPQTLTYTLLRTPAASNSGYETATVTVKLTDSVNTVAVPSGVKYVIPNTDGSGYGDFVLDRPTADYCLNNLPAFTDPVARLSVIMTLNENRLNGRLPADEFTAVVLGHLLTEQEPLIFTAAVGYVRDACLRTQMGRNPVTERALMHLVESRTEPALKQAAFRALLDVFTLPETTSVVYRMWDKPATAKGLELSERDRMKMAYELAVRMPDRAAQLVKRQADRITNPDRQREFLFVAQAVSPSAGVRDSLFNSLLVAANRRMEPWVEQMMYYLNHPLREEGAVKYITPALEQLTEIQRTGDIFFPKNWLSACLRGHNSPAAAQAVQQFLEANPDYPPLLKNKILQSADHLFRHAGH